LNEKTLNVSNYETYFEGKSLIVSNYETNFKL